MEKPTSLVGFSVIPTSIWNLGHRRKIAVRNEPLACVMGDMDLVRPLGLAGIPCAVAARRGGPPRYSRFTCASLDWNYPRSRGEELVDSLIRFGTAQSERPILFYEHDDFLLLVSRFRDRLQRAFRFVIPDAALVEALADKARFQRLARELDLPVPNTCHLRTDAGQSAADIGLRFPVILKPLTRHDRDRPWVGVAGNAKALRVESPAALLQLWPRLSNMKTDFLAQELVPGPETAIESYHVYVDEGGAIAGEFAGKKVRTLPVEYGHSTALMITDTRDVLELGRRLVQRIALRGVAKLDFKRAPSGKLYLLEINPRFTLWNHLGAIAGVNIPAMVYADLVGRPRPAAARAQAGMKWCSLWQDARAAKAWGVPLHHWIPWVWQCEVKSEFAWDDPMPLLRGKIMARVSRLFSFTGLTRGSSSAR
jgi:D-aspartate ligase